MSHQYSYDDSFEPPALILDIKVTHPTNGRSVSIPAKVDTGADACVLPRTIRDKLSLNPAGEVEMSDFRGIVQATEAFWVTIEIEGVTSDFLQVTLRDKDVALIGRDLLSKCKMSADGKSRTFSLEDP